MTSLVYQVNDYSCGTVSFMNAARILGLEYSYDDAKVLVKTTSRGGTSKVNLVRGIRDAGLRAVIYRQPHEEAAWKWLRYWVDSAPVILLVDDRQHWALAHGKSNGSIILIDPTADVKKSENGVYILSRSDLMWRWRDSTCYAIRVTRR